MVDHRGNLLLRQPLYCPWSPAGPRHGSRRARSGAFEVNTSSGVPVATLPFAMYMTLSRNCMSGFMSWATRNAVTLRDLTTVFISPTRSLMRLMSRLERGSSSSSISGLLTSASARNILCSSPPDNEPRDLFASSVAPTTSSVSEASFFSSRVDRLKPQPVARECKAHQLFAFDVRFVVDCVALRYVSYLGIAPPGLRAEYVYGPADRLLKTEKQAEHRRLACPVGADDRDELAAVDAEACVLPDWFAGVTHSQVLCLLQSA